MDAETYFVSRFEVYLGKEETRSGDKVSLGYIVIDSLGRPYFNSYRHFYFNNYFSLVSVIRHLLKNKIYTCSPLCHDRKHFPTGLKNITLK